MPSNRCKCHNEYEAITLQLVRIADALEASNAAAPELYLTNALGQAAVSDERIFSDLQGYAVTTKHNPGTVLRELVAKLKAGYLAP